MQTHEGFTADGYVVTISRSDYRISLEGISKIGDISETDMEDFEELASEADIFVCDEHMLSCWFD